MKIYVDINIDILILSHIHDFDNKLKLEVDVFNLYISWPGTQAAGVTS